MQTLREVQEIIKLQYGLSSYYAINSLNSWRKVAKFLWPHKKFKKSVEARKAVLKEYSKYKYTASQIFYSTDEWRKVRYEALKRHGAKCQCCGRSPKIHGVVLHVDHIKPRSKYPHLALDINNLQVLCEDCNMGKKAHDETDWRPPAVIRRREGKIIRIA